MTRTLIAVALLAHSMLLLPAGCAWWQSRGKGEATAAVQCLEGKLSSQVAVLVADALAGNLSALLTVGDDVLQCAAAALVQTPTEPRTMAAGVYRRDAALRAVRAEIERRRAITEVHQ